MKKELLKTGDGSTTLHLPQWNEQYHSKHGAIQEALHVYIKEGLEYVLSLEDLDVVNILEIGFGTGLNALLTYTTIKALDSLEVNYTGLEAFPIEVAEITDLNFSKQLGIDNTFYTKLHTSDWELKVNLSERFHLTKRNLKFEDFKGQGGFHLIYFDAFGPRVQPELWKLSIFEQMYAALKPNGVLVTYSAKGDVRRAMQQVGFEVARIPGPPGKREMLRAIKKI